MFKNKIVKYLFVGFSLFGANPFIIAQHNSFGKIRFTTLDSDEGLSNSTILTIEQDSLNYVWFGTKEGLNRYDGYSFKVFSPIAGDSSSISSSAINKILYDSNNNLWVAGDKGVSRFNYLTSTFKNYNIILSTSERYITDVLEDDRGNIWATNLTGDFFKYHKEQDAFIKIKAQNESGEYVSYVNDVCLKGSNLLIAANDGLYSFDTETTVLVKIKCPIENYTVNRIVCEDDKYLAGTEGEGLYVLNDKFETIVNYRNTKHKNSICNNKVRAIKVDENGNYWIGTFKGLSIIDINSGQIASFQENFGKPFSLSQNSVKTLYEDNEGGMWIGTYYGGVNYYHPDKIKFDLINQNGGRFSLSDNVVSVVSEDSKNNIWIGTNDKGLNYWDREKNTIKNFVRKKNSIYSLSSNNIKSLAYASNGRLLVGTHRSGLNLFDPKTLKNKIYNTSNSAVLTDNSIYALLKIDATNFLVGTWKGVFNFNTTTEKFTYMGVDSRGNKPISENITFLFKDSRKRIWIGARDGLTLYKPSLNLYETFSNKSNDSNSLLGNEVSCIYEDEKGRIWIGTRKGLNLFNELDRNFYRFAQKDGLPSNFIYGILEDDNNNFWISTNNGISRFNYQTKQFINYNKLDGVHNKQFNFNSFQKTSDNLFLFGGLKGLTIFKPEYLINSYDLKPVYITKLSLYNEEVKPNDSHNILSQDILFTKNLTLGHHQNVFKLNYNAVNFNNAERTVYEYKLEGFDENWIEDSKELGVNYSNLPAGSYTFKIRTKNYLNDNKGPLTTLKISVLSPWWLSKFMKVFYVMLIALVLFLVLKIIRDRLYRIQKIKIGEIEKEKLSEINKMKLEFYTNITHEFKTPLTLILSPIQKLREEYIEDGWVNKQHTIIYNNALRLLNLINQLLDFRKSEQGILKLKVVKGDLSKFIGELYESYALVASENKIKYNFKIKSDGITGYFDPSYIEKIVFNLLSNAFKFTPKGGRIDLKLELMDGKLAKITVADNGKGVPLSEQDKIFGRYYQVEENSFSKISGTGIGLTLTKRLVELHKGTIDIESENKGAKFIVSIPIDKKSFDIDDFRMSNEVENTVTIESQPLVANIIEEEAVAFKPENEKLLIVDDNADIRNYLATDLSKSYNILTAEDGSEALEVLKENEDVSLIVSDVMMPNIDGVQLCKKLKKNIKTSHIPIILLTAKSSIEEQIEGVKVGADDYISKPFSLALLEVKIKNIIKARRRLKEVFSNSDKIDASKIAFNSYDEKLLKKAMDILEYKYADPTFSVDVFASEMGMSRSNLHLKLKAITGESATFFINKVRFSKSLEFIQENEYSISEISYKVGFNSPSYFSTSFKRHFGYLPTEYIEKLKNDK